MYLDLREGREIEGPDCRMFVVEVFRWCMDLRSVSKSPDCQM